MGSEIKSESWLILCLFFTYLSESASESVSARGTGELTITLIWHFSLVFFMSEQNTSFSFPVFRLFPVSSFFQPAVAGVFPIIEFRDVGFDVNEGGVVQNVYFADFQYVSNPVFQFYDGHANAVGTAWMAGCKDAVGGVIQKGRPGQENFPCPVKDVEENDMGKGINGFQPGFEFREDFNPAFPFRGKGALNGTFILRFVGGEDCADPDNLKFHLLHSMVIFEGFTDYQT